MTDTHKPNSLAKIIIGLLILALSIHLAWYHVSKTLMDIAGVLGIFYILIYRKDLQGILEKKDWIWLAILASLPLSYLLSYSLHDTALDFEHFKNTLRIVIIGSVTYLIFTLHPKYSAAALERAIVICTLSGGAAGLYFWSLHDFSSRSTSGTNLIIIYASVLAGTTCVTLSILLNKTLKPHQCFLYAFAMLLGIAGVIASGSRGPALGMAFIFTIIFLCNKNKYLKFFYLSIMPIAFIALSQTQIMGSRLESMIHNIGSYFAEEGHEAARVTSSGIRLEMWYAALDYIPEKPLFGYGNQNLKNIFFADNRQNDYPLMMGSFEHVHNDILQAWLGRGLTGFFVLLLLFYYPYRKTRLSSPGDGSNTYIIISAYAITGLTDLCMVHTTSLSFYIVAVSALLAQSSGKI